MLKQVKQREVSDDVIDILYRSTTNGRKLTLPEMLPRQDYLTVNKIIEALGGTWNRHEKGHVFPVDARDAIDPVLLTGMVQLPTDFGFFPTPPDIADRVIARAKIERGMKVLEPSAGAGALVTRALRLTNWVDCIELQERKYKDLVDIVMAAQSPLPGVFNHDFLDIDPHAWPKAGARILYDRCVMNPPFARRADIAHVIHALRFMKPDGILVAIMSAGVLFRSDMMAETFRAKVDRHGGSIEKLPSGSFKESGTLVETCLVTIPEAGSVKAHS